MTSKIDQILHDLLGSTGASRCTLREDMRGDVAYPVTHEAVAPGVHSIKELTDIDQRKQPVVRHILQHRRQVIQNDASTAYDDREFRRMRQAYGGLAAQIVTPVLADGKLIGIISLHQLGRKREWSNTEIDACQAAASAVAEIRRVQTA